VVGLHFGIVILHLWFRPKVIHSCFDLDSEALFQQIFDVLQHTYVCICRNADASRTKVDVEIEMSPRMPRLNASEDRDASNKFNLLHHELTVSIFNEDAV
jgi:hypothetical protein